MRVLILHDEVAEDAAPDARDALTQAGLFAARLVSLGHEVRTEGVGLDLRPTARLLDGCDLVVNLVEALDGRGSMIHLVPAVVEATGVPMTGCPAWSIAATSNKLTAKRAMRTFGVPTPEWIEAGDPPPAAGRWIVKSVWEHASIGLSAGSVVDAAEAAGRIATDAPRLGGAAFAEAFIEGREFNLSVLEVDGVARVLPPAEIRFVDFGEGRPRIVDYEAKWVPGAFAYENTPRTFEFGADDAGLLEQLGETALRCWDAFGLRGSARVDFRVDEAGRPWVLEVNTNPCLAPDAGFAAAAERAGLSLGAVVDALVSAALRPPKRDREPPRARTGLEVGRVFREEVRAADEAAVRAIARATGFFRDDEVEVAAELVRERVEKGEASGYRFLLADGPGGRLDGYACFGPIACTVGAFDLFWIIVDPARQGAGLGRSLMDAAEAAISAVGGRAVYVETSSLPRYAPTRRFYERCGYALEARLRGFYQDGDDKLVYVKRVGPARGA